MAATVMRARDLITAAPPQAFWFASICLNLSSASLGGNSSSSMSWRSSITAGLPRPAGVKAAAVEQHAGARQFLVVRGHLGHEFLGGFGCDFGLELGAGLDDDHESHGVLLEGVRPGFHRRS